MTLTDETPDGWHREGNLLHRDFELGDFVDAFGFMTRVALVAEKLNHHPDWSNSWNRVSVDITSHDEGGVTTRCVELARAINSIATSNRA